MAAARIHFAHLNARIYAATGGRIGGNFGGHRVLLLTTKGRKSGRDRRTPVQFESIDETPVIAAAGGGSPHAPLWCGNLRAHDRAKVQIGRDKWIARGEEVAGAERASLWQRLTELNPALVAVEHKAGREIPLFRLIRQSDLD